MEDTALLALAARLATVARQPAPVALERLAGGKNNRVFRVSFADGSAAVLKSYFHDPRDTRDRLKAEWGFLNYAWTRGVRVIPKPMAQDHKDHAALYSLLPGRKLAPGEPDADHVAATLDFIVAANATPKAVETLPPGSEACFALAEHVDRLDKRLARLEAIAEDAPLRDQALALVRHRLKPLHAAVRARILAESGAVAAPLLPHERIASPSDLGFHNALIDDAGQLRFFDFEYAGQDDPAKLAGDFFCCPEIPAPIGQFDNFVQGLGRDLALDGAFSARARLLLDAYRIKWACIILNDFLPVDATRRAFAVDDERARRCAVQLDKARAKLAEIDA